MNTQPERINATTPDPFAGYAQAAGSYDEMFDAQGNVRAHWQPFAERFRQGTHAQYVACAEKLARMVRENGIAEDLFAEASAPADPWKIDLIPLIFSATEWRWLEKAIIQRARLFDTMLEDLYGAQNLLASGKIPPQLILSDHTYLRPLKGTGRGRGRLAFYAADLARGADGRWRITDSHAETTAGSGFALSNRIVHSRVASGLFSACNVLRLAPFFDGLQGELLSRAGHDDAAIGLLTPGPHHEDYFGHAYLARYLNMLLVEGGDLRVVGNRVYVKALEGLQPLDLIVRSVEASMSDPLELDPASSFGPAGFVQALRANPDLVTNTLGTAVIENRGLGPYLAALCQDLLGEPLALWDTPRWWLGDAAGRQHALKNLANVAIRPVQEGTGRPGRGGHSFFPATLSAAELARLKDEIALHGSAYVAEEQVPYATVPSWTPDGPRPQPYAVRLYAALIDGEFRVMPGGIALGVAPNTCVALHSPEGYSRDVWVMANGEAPAHVSRLRQRLDTPKISRGSTGLRSRVADNLFWLGRYTERADWTMRLLRGALNRLTPDASGFAHHEAVAKALNVLLVKDKGVVVLHKDDDGIEPLAHALMSGRGRSYGVIATLDQVRQTASLIRDRLSVELWRTLQTIQTSRIWRGEAEPGSVAEALECLDEGIATLAAFNGMAAENMTRNYGWTFLEIGRRLERAVNLSEQLLGLFGERQDEAAEAARLHFALESADSTLTYRSRYLHAPVLPLVLDLLMADETNPRSIVYQLEAISRHFDALPQTARDPLPQSVKRRLILDLVTRVKLADVFELSACSEETGAPREAFKALFTQLTADLPRLSEAIARRYFSLTENEMRRISPLLGPRP